MPGRGRLSVSEVGRERHASGDASYEAWTLRAYPSHSTAKDFLHPVILRYLDPRVEKSEVFVTQDGSTAVQVILLRGLRVESVNWFQDLPVPASETRRGKRVIMRR